MQNFTCFALLRNTLSLISILFTGLSPSMVRLSRLFNYTSIQMLGSYNPDIQVYRFGLLPFRSPLLGESNSLSFPLGTEMFHFPRFASLRMTRHYSSRVSPFGYLRIKAISSSPKLIAGNRALHRLSVPRHPPCALSILSITIALTFSSKFFTTR
jgi:hypothetical protein